MLAKALGVQHLVIILNKMDEGSVLWNKKRLEEIRTQLGTYLIRSCGYKKEELSFIPISGLTGENIKEGVKTQAGKWY